MIKTEKTDITFCLKRMCFSERRGMKTRPTPISRIQDLQTKNDQQTNGWTDQQSEFPSRVHYKEIKHAPP